MGVSETEMKAYYSARASYYDAVYEKPERRMVRTLDGSTRAFLSDRYRPLDNFDLAHEVFHVLTWDSLPPRRVDYSRYDPIAPTIRSHPRYRRLV